MPQHMGMHINTNHLPIFLDNCVNLPSFDAKDVPIFRDILFGNVLGKQFKGFIIQSFPFSFSQ